MNSEKSPKTYCIVCKKETENKTPKISRSKIDLVMLKSICSECNNTKSRFIKDHYKL